MLDLVISIVAYNNKEAEISLAIRSALLTDLKVKVIVVDNSPIDTLKSIRAIDNRVEYIFTGNNIGFGAAHNIALYKSIETAKYHLILNPDISFSAGVLDKIFAFMDANPNVGMVSPKILYNDGSLQKLCKLLPTPVDLIGRRFLPSSFSWVKKRNERYELSNFNYESCVNIPNLSGCFMFLRNEVLKKVGLFDNRYFMYLEDVDLSRRIHKFSETVFFNEVEIFHGFKKESYSSPRLLAYHMRSAIKYFNKWGWFLDPERRKFNNQVLKRIENI